MTHLRHWLIAAAWLSATHSSGLAAEPLEAVHATVTGATSEPAEPHVQVGLQDPPISVQRFLVSGREDSEPAGPSLIPGNAAGGRLVLRSAALAAHAVQPLQRIEIGFRLSNDALVNGFRDWYGVYLQGLDRVAERNTIYGLLRETPPPGLNDSKAPSAFCCQRNNTLASLSSIDKYASTVTGRQASPTYFLFGMLRRKGVNFNLEEGWKLQAGVRDMQLSSVLQTKVGFFTAERYWESFRTSYSYQLERSGGAGLAPSHVLQFDYLYSPRDSIGVSVANGRELADFGPLGILNTETRNVAVRGQHWFKQDWALTFQAGYNDHGSLPAQQGVRMGLRHRF